MENIVKELQEQMQELKRQNEELLTWKTEIDKIMEMLPGALKSVNDAIMNSKNELQDNDQKLLVRETIIEKRVFNLEYEMNDPRRKENKDKFFYPNIADIDVTIEQIVHNGKSLARFGDGEFELMNGKQRWAFQELSEKLQRRLIEVIQSSEEKLLIGIADNYGMLDSYTLEGASAIRSYMTEEVRKNHRKFLEPDKEYCNAYITRPYIMYADRETDASRKRFDNLKRMWAGRNVIIVEGAQTRFGVGNDLLAGALSVRRILAPATNSFSRYEEILEAALTNANTNDLFLVALGPCAGVLVYDLCLRGMQAIDVGHMDLEYEWFLQGEGRRIRIPYKYCSEVINGDQVEECQDPAYKEQIVAEYE